MEMGIIFLLLLPLTVCASRHKTADDQLDLSSPPLKLFLQRLQNHPHFPEETTPPFSDKGDLSRANFLQESKVLRLVEKVFAKMLSNNGTLLPMPMEPSPSFQLPIIKAVLTTITINYTTTTPMPPPFTSEEDVPATAIPVIAVGILFALLTALGNAFVMISIRVDRQLQTISNYFLFSLAVADFAIGIISIPLMTYYTANGRWGIGYGACQFWLSVDYLMSNASVLNLLLISFDRYFSVTKPLTYRPMRTTKKALVMISLTYIVSAVIWPPFIISWPYIEGRFTTEPGTCVVQFLVVTDETNQWTRQVATIGTAMVAFYLPVSIMIYLYYRVYMETKRRQAEFRKLQAGQVGYFIGG